MQLSWTPLRLLPLFLVTAEAQECEVVRRVDCGKLGTTKEDCLAAGCCWAPVDPNPHNQPWCFHQAAPSGPISLTIRYPDSELKTLGSQLFLRGNGTGMSWDQGVALQHSASDTWTVSLPAQVGQAFQFKALVDDKIWAVGANSFADARSSSITRCAMAGR